jgi:hypothetical protein
MASSSSWAFSRLLPVGLQCAFFLLLYGAVLFGRFLLPAFLIARNGPF